MNRSAGAIQYHRLRAPNEHGETLIDPPPAEVACLLKSNIGAARDWEYDCQGSSWRALFAQARQHLLTESEAYTLRYRDVATCANSSDVPVMMTGHQPELYHPGVWLKNFYLAKLAREHRAVAINVLIDNDTLRSAGLRVPTGDLHEPHVEFVPFDRPTEELPHEERSVLDADQFTKFAEAACGQLAPLVDAPLLPKLWPAAVEALRSGAKLGQCLAQARHRLEADWGLQTWELPWSSVCDSTAFRWFTVHVLAHLDRFQQIYNDSLQEYRRIHHVRSQTHPVPSLATEDGWLEAPFWLWSTDAPQRRRMFVRHRRNGLEMTDRQRLRVRLSLTSDGLGERAVEQLREYTARGLKVRSRALLTTTFARMFLCDLFIHGIGGAKYDQLTDTIVERFFGRSAPPYVTVSGTAKLPIPQASVSKLDLRDVQVLLRDLRFNPQRHVPVTPDSEALVSAKLRLIEATRQVDQDPRHFQKFTSANEALQPLVAERRAELLRQHERVRQQLRIAKVLGSREYSFVLFPEETLRPFLLDI